MCGIAGSISLSWTALPALERELEVMNAVQRHRGPDGSGVWQHPEKTLGLAHRRLGIIDLSRGGQPMTDENGRWLSFNGEIYNFLELRNEIGKHKFRTDSDTEVILRGYDHWGSDCLNHFRGMWSFALWDEQKKELFCSRDRLGIKPFYYLVKDGVLRFASEVKALLPFLDQVEIDTEALKEYLTFQFCLSGRTLFKDIQELRPGHTLTVSNGRVIVRKYWEVVYQPDKHHSALYFEERLRGLLEESVDLHLRSDVPIGAYLSGGLDSSIVSSLAAARHCRGFEAFIGKFAGPEYDESPYAREVAKEFGFELHELEIKPEDFIDNIRKVIYHLDYPTAGPGSFNQYMISALAARTKKVVLGGQGADEIFGGYVRYLIAYFEQCIKGAINGTLNNGNYVVTYESIIPNLTALQRYQPMLQEFWREGLFEEMDRRYFRLVARTPDIGDPRSEIRWGKLGVIDSFDKFSAIFNMDNVSRGSYFDRMTHFDLKTLLPALLHVEDRVSMAHGLESRVPFLDHKVVEFAATIPADVKFQGGKMKQVLKSAMQSLLPDSIVNRKDKMGFPIPLTSWLNGPCKEFASDIFSTKAACERPYIDNQKVLENLHREPQFGRKAWGLLSLELWMQEFVDKHWEYKRLLTSEKPENFVESLGVEGRI